MRLLLLLLALSMFSCGTTGKIQTVEQHQFDRYLYECTVVSVYDGDTQTLVFHLGLGVDVTHRTRLARVDTPELRGPEREEGLYVADYVRRLLVGKKVWVQTDEDKKGKYGRIITEIWFYGEPGWINLSDHLLHFNLAKPYTDENYQLELLGEFRN